MILTDIDVMLLGKTGAGKSKTGNSILDRNAFRTVATTASATIKSQREITELHDGRILCVVDTPGLADNRGTQDDGEKMFNDAISDAIFSNPNGYHALVIVLRFGSRFTEEDTNVITFLKKTFGDNFISKYCIIIMSCGDQFKNEKEDGNITGTFEEWCKEQEGYFQEMVGEVKERIILFDNRASKEEQNEQRKKLVGMIDRLMQGGRRYTDEKFNKARQLYEKQIREEEISKIALEIQKELSLILLKLDRVKSSQDVNLDAQINILKDLMEQVKGLLKTIDEEKPVTGDLIQSKQVVLDAQHQIELQRVIVRSRQDLERQQKTESSARADEIRELKKQLDDLKSSSNRHREQLDTQYKQVRDKSSCIIS